MKSLTISLVALALAACAEESPAPAPAASVPQSQAPATTEQAKAADAANPRIETKPASAVAAPAPPAANPDVELAARVKKALEEASGEIAQGVDVTATHGTVRLYGTVSSAQARSRAASIASATPGVSAVENNLVVLKGS